VGRCRGCRGGVEARSGSSVRAAGSARRGVVRPWPRRSHTHLGALAARGLRRRLARPAHAAGQLDEREGRRGAVGGGRLCGTAAALRHSAKAMRAAPPGPRGAKPRRRRLLRRCAGGAGRGRGRRGKGNGLRRFVPPSLKEPIWAPAPRSTLDQNEDNEKDSSSGAPSPYSGYYRDGHWHMVEFPIWHRHGHRRWGYWPPACWCPFSSVGGKGWIARRSGNLGSPQSLKRSGNLGSPQSLKQPLPRSIR
jgi:hypothetical protein